MQGEVNWGLNAFACGMFVVAVVALLVGLVVSGWKKDR